MNYSITILTLLLTLNDCCLLNNDTFLVKAVSLDRIVENISRISLAVRVFLGISGLRILKVSEIMVLTG